MEKEWSQFTTINEGIAKDFSANIIAMFIDSPVVALLFQVLLFVLFYTVFHLFMAIIYTLSKKKTLIIITVIVFWVISVVSFKWFPSDYSLFILPNYLSYVHGVHSFGNIWSPLIIIIFFSLILLLVFTGIDSKLKLIISSINWKFVFYGLLVLLGLLHAFQENQVQSFQDLLIATFLGSSHEGFNFIDYMFYIIIYYGFVYLVHFYFYNELSNLSFYKILRYGSINSWILNCFRKVLISIFLLLISLFNIIIIVAFFLGFKGNEPFFSNVTFFDITYHFFINGFLQLLLYILLAFIMIWISKEVFPSFAILVILLLFMLPGLNFYLIFPSGLNSMGLLIDEVSPYRITITLFIYLTILLITIYHLINNTDFDIFNH